MHSSEAPGPGYYDTGNAGEAGRLDAQARCLDPSSFYDIDCALEAAGMTLWRARIAYAGAGASSTLPAMLAEVGAMVYPSEPNPLYVAEQHQTMPGHAVQARIEHLPYQPASMDAAYERLTLAWTRDPAAALCGLHQITHGPTIATEAGWRVAGLANTPPNSKAEELLGRVVDFIDAAEFKKDLADDLPDLVRDICGSRVVEVHRSLYIGPAVGGLDVVDEQVGGLTHALHQLASAMPQDTPEGRAAAAAWANEATKMTDLFVAAREEIIAHPAMHLVMPEMVTVYTVPS